MAAEHTLAAYREGIETLLDQWGRVDGFQAKPRDIPRLRVLAGLCAASHDQARTALLLWDNGMLRQSAPLVRVAFECALRAAWTAHYGVEDFLADANLAHHKRVSEAVAAFGQRRPGDVQRLVELAENDEERRKAIDLKSLCDKIHGGGDLYYVYRALSGESHPGWPVVGRHFYDQDGQLGIRHDVVTSQHDEFWGWVLLASLVWCSRAVDDIDQEHPRRSTVRDVALDHDVPLITFKR